MKNIILLLLLIGFTAIGAAQNTTVYFTTGSDTLTAQAKETLNKLGSTLNNETDLLTITGYTDADGTAEDNMQLSLNRARTVTNYLRNQGVLCMINAESKGETTPIGNNTTANGKAQNRRVTIAITKATENNFTEAHNIPYQTFAITQNTDTILVCKGGTKISIANNSFNTANPNATVTLQVKEYLTKQDFLFANLTSVTTHSQLLASKGMLHIAAYSNNKEVNLKKGKAITLLFKDRTDNDGTLLFSGVPTNNGVYWVPEKNTNATVLPREGANVLTIKTNNKTVVRDTIGTINTLDGSSLTREEATYYTKTDKNGNSVTYRLEPKYNADGTKSYDTIQKSATNQNYNKLVLNNLVQKIEKLHFINCDAFYNNPNPKTNIAVTIDKKVDASVFLVFKDVNGIMKVNYRENDNYIFTNVPTNTKITVVALFKGSNSKDYLFDKKIVTTSSNLNTPLTMVTTTTDNLNQALKNL